jgi:hypothetical protein
MNHITQGPILDYTQAKSQSVPLFTEIVPLLNNKTPSVSGTEGE